MDELEDMLEQAKQMAIDDVAMQFAAGITGRKDLTTEQAHEIVHAVCRASELT